MKEDLNHKEGIIEHVLHLEKDIEGKMKTHQKNPISRFPFIFLGLSTFGGVMVFHGFEKIIDQTPYLSNNPLGILILGFIILILTGALYRKLQ
jgi:hypothetical protein